MSTKAIIKKWNEEHPLGTEVIVVKDDGSRIPTRTRSYAEILGGHTPVVWLEGISGCYRLDRVEVLEV